MLKDLGRIGPVEQAAVLFLGNARGNEVLGRAGLVDGGDGGVTCIGEHAGAVDYLLKYGLEVEACTDAQARLAERGKNAREAPRFRGGVRPPRS